MNSATNRGPRPSEFWQDLADAYDRACSTSDPVVPDVVAVLRRWGITVENEQTSAYNWIKAGRQQGVIAPTSAGGVIPGQRARFDAVARVLGVEVDALFSAVRDHAGGALRTNSKQRGAA